MRLYMHAGACSLAPHIVCRELAIPIELVEVDRKTRITSCGEDFTRINGNGYVPVLALDDGQTLMEGAAIVQYLADLDPEATLLPRPGSDRAFADPILAEFHRHRTAQADGHAVAAGLPAGAGRLAEFGW